MGLHHNPRIVTDGLVFAYDVANGKSYKGAPTTNILQNTVFTTGWIFNGASYAAGKLTETADPTTGTRLAPGTINIGGGANTTMDGSIASFRIYDRALLAAEVKQNFEAARARFGI